MSYLVDSASRPHVTDEIHLPLDLIIDLVSHLYIFYANAQTQDSELLFQINIDRRIAHSGPWWRIFYGLGLQQVIHRISQQVKRDPNIASTLRNLYIEPMQVDIMMPYVKRVKDLLDIWRNESINIDEKKSNIISYFPAEIRQVLNNGKTDSFITQFDEIRVPCSNGISDDFFFYLQKCPLNHLCNDYFSLDDAVHYWAWIDNVVIFRTCLYEEKRMNIRVNRMLLAKQFFNLLTLIYQNTKYEFRIASFKCKDELREICSKANLEFLIENYERLDKTALNYYKPFDVFIRYPSFNSCLCQLTTTINGLGSI